MVLAAGSADLERKKGKKERIFGEQKSSLKTDKKGVKNALVFKFTYVFKVV